jgi:hypothetical protein
MATPITEVKRHLDGRVERFRCALVLRRPHVVVVRFEHRRGRRAGGLPIPAGSRSYGFFWARRSYVLYRIAGPAGDVIGHRFDAVEAVELGEREVSYADLLLDVWVGPDGAPRVEDEDEVRAAARRGRLSAAQRGRIARAKRTLLRRHRAIEREAARLLAAAGAR